MHLSDIWRAHCRGYTLAQTYDDVIGKKHALLEIKCDVQLEGTAGKLIRRLRKLHCKHAGRIVAATNQRKSASQLHGLIVSVEVIETSPICI